MQLLSQITSEKVALNVQEEHLSFGYLQKAVKEMSQQLQKLPPGILILKARHTSLFVIQVLAAFAIEKPIAIISEQSSEVIKALLGTCMTVDAQGELVEFHQDHSIRPHPELALVLFTSGSTGEIKAVQLSAKNIIANCDAVIKALEFSRVENQLLFLPLSYSFGLLGQLLPALKVGVSTKLIHQFTDIKALLETAEVPQMWSGVPSHWVAIIRMFALYPENAHHIKAIVSAGAPLPVSLRESLKHTFPNAILYNNYGLTEASPRVLTYSSQDPLFFKDYAGYPVGDWQNKLSENNELLIKGNQLMLGYLDNESNARFQDGWLCTGDQAEILPSGLVAIKGRIDNVVNIAGEKVNLTEIEQALCQIEGIKEVVVLAIPDELYGVRLLACLEQKYSSIDQNEQRLAEQFRVHLLPRKLPVSVRFFDKLPRTTNGKPDRKTLLLNFKESGHA
ncbi:MAG: fatty acid--CoA ligase family protein [Legionella sp.]|nr:fatty acid--CoA ligase family protein [Legionella sp.]